jgi:arylformamidase
MNVVGAAGFIVNGWWHGACRSAALNVIWMLIGDGMTTYKGLPPPHICDFWTREDSASNYDDGSSFQIGRIDMVANTGTYVDSPFHRFADGKDLSELPLGRLADLPGIVVRRPYENG